MDKKSFKNVIKTFNNNDIHYWVYGGIALDGIREKISREHDDLDIYLHTIDFEKTLEILCAEKYSCFNKGNMYLATKDDIKIDIVLLSEDSSQYVVKGNKTIARYPRNMFFTKKTASIEEITFSIVPNEVLVFESSHSIHEQDKEFGSKLLYNKELFDQIKSTSIKTEEKLKQVYYF